MKLFVIFLVGELVLHTSASTVIQLTEEHGSFESPQFPEAYREDLDITWEINAPEGYQIVVYFTTFDLEDSYDEDLGGVCAYDYVQVENWGRVRRLCGNFAQFPSDAPAPLQRFRSENNSMTIRFVSDYSNEDPHIGFKAHYVVEDKDECAVMRDAVRTTFEDWDLLVYCDHYCINVPGSYYCTCRPGFELHDNQHTCKASCENEVITDDEGFIVSPDYPQPYSKLTNCSWTIQVREGLSLDLQFNRLFEIEDHYNYTECVYDYLKLEYGDTNELHCHGAPNNGSLIRTNVREVKLQFFTDLSTELKGFNMTFNTTRTRCLDPRDAPENGMKPDNPNGYYEFENVIEFSCNPGYNLIGSDSTTCQHDGTWTNPAPTCQIKSCGMPTNLSAVPYSNLPGIDQLGLTFEDVVRVQCNDWYEMTFGVDEWICSRDAEWIPTTPGFDAATSVPVCSPKCGIKNDGSITLVHRFIAGGLETLPNEWPWVVFIHHARDPELATSRQVCGGALISADYVLTAAHCIQGSIFSFLSDAMADPEDVHVWIGAHDRSNSSRARNISVERIIPHPSFDDPTLNFDFALLQLSETVLMNDIVRPICLPKINEDFDLMVFGNTSGIVAGWGIHSTADVASQVLRYTEMPTVMHSTCWSRFQMARMQFNVPNLHRLTANKFCAGGRFGGAGNPCRGDSGGPFMVEDDSDPRNPKYYTFGLVSYGIRCLARQDVLSSFAYTVFAYLNTNITQWINQEMN